MGDPATDDAVSPSECMPIVCSWATMQPLGEGCCTAGCTCRGEQQRGRQAEELEVKLATKQAVEHGTALPKLHKLSKVQPTSSRQHLVSRCAQSGRRRQVTG